MMLLFIILALILLILWVVTVLAVSVGGAGAIILFGDVIVCMAIIIWIMRRISKRKKR
jgi:hypothetical protein